MEVAIESAASAACTAAGRGASLDLGPLDLVLLKTAQAADLITASKSEQRSPLRSENHKKMFPNQQQEAHNFPNPVKTNESHITRHIRIQIAHV